MPKPKLPYLHEDISGLAKFLSPSALSQRINSHPEPFSIFGTVEIDIDPWIRAGQATTFQDHSLTVPVKIPKGHFSRLEQECQEAERAENGFKQVKNLLWELLGAPVTQASVSPDEMLSVVDYLQQYLQAEGDFFMNSWNQEKFGRIIRLLTQAANNPSGRDPEGWSWARRDAYAAYAPAHWNFPVYPPDEVLNRRAGQGESRRQAS